MIKVKYGVSSVNQGNEPLDILICYAGNLALVVYRQQCYIGGFIIGMLRLVTNVITDTGSKVMEGAFWENTAWFWQTNWLVFECWLLVFIVALMVVVSFFTPAPSKAQVEAITFTSDYRKQIRESWCIWDVVATLGVIALCACFYAYFW